MDKKTIKDILNIFVVFCIVLICIVGFGLVYKSVNEKPVNTNEAPPIVFNIERRTTPEIIQNDEDHWSIFVPNDKDWLDTGIPVSYFYNYSIRLPSQHPRGRATQFWVKINEVTQVSSCYDGWAGFGHSDGIDLFAGDGTSNREGKFRSLNVYVPKDQSPNLFLRCDKNAYYGMWVVVERKFCDCTCNSNSFNDCPGKKYKGGS